MSDFRSFESVEDLLSDESFLEYCSGKDAAAAEHWEAWMLMFPERKALVAQAKQILIASIIEMDDAHDSLEKLRASLAEQVPLSPASQIKPEEEPKTGNNRFPYLRFAIAASLLALLACMILLNPLSNKEDYVYVSADKIMSLYLPDSTLMVLNKGTSIRYSANYSDSGKVFIKEGEVFFRMNETSTVSLTVHTAAGLKVKDIGTEFSVKSYNGLSEEAIQVQEGIVDVYREDVAAPIRLTRNRALRVNKTTGDYIFSKANELSTSGWAKGEIALYDVRFDEAAAALAGTFDTKVILADPALSELRVTIFFKADQKLENIIETLSTIYNLTVSYEDGLITIAMK